MNLENFAKISLEHYLVLAVLLFIIGMTGLILQRKNIINLLMSIELMLLAANINFVAFSCYRQDLSGQVFTIIVLTVAAAEVSIGLAILMLYFKKKGSIDVNDLNQLKG